MISAGETHSILALIAALAVLVAPAAANVGSPEPNWRIELHRRFTGMACAGLCADTDLTVSADGAVHWEGWDPFHHRLEGMRNTRRASHAALARFRRALLSIRPNTDTDDREGCDSPYHVAGVWDLEIVWRDHGAATRLRSCDNRRIIDAFYEASRLIGFF